MVDDLRTFNLRTEYKAFKFIWKIRLKLYTQNIWIGRKPFLSEESFQKLMNYQFDTIKF